MTVSACVRGHVIAEVGRNGNGRCRECARLDRRGLLPIVSKSGLPFEPLERLIRARGLQIGMFVSGSSAVRYRRVGIDPYTADGICGRLGLHPSELWPDWDRDEVSA